ncbi:MAG: ribosomal L7Ae/L30e/S12e/Gadd45 family protein [Candidatus Aenigmatarchaeota archaeon]
MERISEIKEELKKGNVIYGFRKCLKYLKLKEPKLVIVTRDIPENMKGDILSSVMDKSKVIETEMNSIELGIALGKPFPISVLVVRK